MRIVKKLDLRRKKFSNNAPMWNFVVISFRWACTTFLHTKKNVAPEVFCKKVLMGKSLALTVTQKFALEVDVLRPVQHTISQLIALILILKLQNTILCIEWKIVAHEICFKNFSVSKSIFATVTEKIVFKDSKHTRLNLGWFFTTFCTTKTKL